MPIAPAPPAVDPKSPWDPDPLGRKSFGEGVANVIRLFPKPLCISVSGPWGSGKSTFLDRWQHHMELNHNVCVKFDAWKHDYCHDALMSLVYTMIAKLGSTGNKSSEKFGKKLWETMCDISPHIGKQIIRDGINEGLKTLTGGIMNPENIGNRLKDVSPESLFDDMKEDMKKMEDVQKAFSDLVSNTLGESKDELLIVIIDELDRCKPTFALELLEGVKHLFTCSDRVVFVFGIDHEQLAHSIAGAYGPGFDGHRYLRRIIELELQLPRPASFTHLPLIEASIMKGVSLKDGPLAQYWISLAKSFQFTLRDMQQFVARVAMCKDFGGHLDFDLAAFTLGLQIAAPDLAKHMLQYGADSSEARKELHTRFKFDHPSLTFVSLPEPWPLIPGKTLIKLMAVSGDPSYREIDSMVHTYLNRHQPPEYRLGEKKDPEDKLTDDQKEFLKKTGSTLRHRNPMEGPRLEQRDFDLWLASLATVSARVG